MGYGITIRVWGEYALFTRPEMKVERVSYDVITPSAARGILEAVYWKPAISWVVDKIHVLNQIEFTNIRRNEVSEKISSQTPEKILAGTQDQIFLSAVDNRQQRASLILKNVDYVIEAHFELNQEKCGQDDTPEKHYNMVLRRLRNGQHFHAPCLGTREFPARVELLENQSIPVSSLTGELDLGWMLYDLDFSDVKDIQPKFFRARLSDGILDLSAVTVTG